MPIQSWHLTICVQAPNNCGVLTRYGNIVIKECENIYSPREDSLLLAESVERYATGDVLDLGTGTGLQGIVAAGKGCNVTFADIEESALKCARDNAEANRKPGKFVISDMFGSISGKFDTIIFNPPYLPSEPLSETDKHYRALDGGIGGRELIDVFIKEYKNFLKPAGKALIVESSLNGYKDDIERLGAEVISQSHYFFEDIVILMLH